MARVLIVDDAEMFRAVLRRALEELGHTVVGEAENGAIGVAMFEEFRPDFTTMDINMPVMDGIEALKRIMAMDPDAKVVMVSSSAQHSKVSESTILGAYDFLQKPFDWNRVSDVLSIALADC